MHIWIRNGLARVVTRVNTWHCCPQKWASQPYSSVVGIPWQPRNNQRGRFHPSRSNAKREETSLILCLETQFIRSSIPLPRPSSDSDPSPWRLVLWPPICTGDRPIEMKCEIIAELYRSHIFLHFHGVLCFLLDVYTLLEVRCHYTCNTAKQPLLFPLSYCRKRQLLETEINAQRKEVGPAPVFLLGSPAGTRHDC